MTRLFLIFSGILLLCVSPFNAMAQDAAAEQVPAGEVTPEGEAEQPVDNRPPLKEPSKKLKSLNEDLAKLTGELNDDERRHFFMIYNSHNMIATVKHVEKEVGGAIDACSKNNPDMADKLNARYKEWTSAVDEKISAAEANRDNMVMAQDYAKPKTIKSAMKQADGLRKETQDYMERVPVTSAEACDYLLNKMDETQDNMIELLQATLVSVPQAMQSASDDAAAARAAAPSPEPAAESAPEQEPAIEEESAPAE